MPDNSVILYSTEGCHLCEQAREQLDVVNVSYTVVDIAFDDTLFKRYGVTIPVVKFAESELNWPFQLEQLQTWLEDNGITYHT